MTAPMIESWVDNGDEFEDLLNSAEDEARSSTEQEFVAEVRQRWVQYGMKAFMTERQYDWLCRIARA